MIAALQCLAARLVGERAASIPAWPSSRHLRGPQTRQLMAATVEAKRSATQESVRHYTSMYPEIQTISGSDVVRLKSEGKDLVLVDVRTPEEQQVSMLPSAITQQDFERQLDAHRQKLIVPYCTMGKRSGDYCRALIAQGFLAEQVRNGEGVVAWTYDVGRLVDREGNETRRVHTFGKAWDHVAEGFEAVYFSAPRAALGMVASVLQSFKHLFRWTTK